MSEQNDYPPIVHQLLDVVGDFLDDDIKYQIVKNLEKKGLTIDCDEIILDQDVNTIIDSIFTAHIYNIIWMYNDHILDIIKTSEEDKEQLFDKIMSLTDKKLKIHNPEVSV